jgi:hypothetical protein
MSALLWEILGAVLVADLGIFLLRHKIALFFGSHGWFDDHRSEELQSDLDTEQEIDSLKKWEKM